MSECPICKQTMFIGKCPHNRESFKLSEQVKSREFDEVDSAFAFERKIKSMPEYNPPVDLRFLHSWWREGAKWMHDALAARNAELEKEIEQIGDNCGIKKPENIATCVYRKSEIESLRAQIQQKDAEIERLKSEKSQLMKSLSSYLEDA